MKWIIRYYKVYFRLLFTLAPKIASQKALAVFSTPLNHKLREREIEVLNIAERQTLHIEGYSIAIYKWGCGNKKALLVHGWEGNGGSLGAIGNLLVSKGYTVYSFDGPAHGKSSGKQTNVIAFSGIVSSLIEKFEIYDLVATHSFGSATSIYALANNPKIVINKMIMLTSPNKLENVMREFGGFLAFRESDLLQMFKAVQRIYEVAVNSLNIEDLTLKTSVKKFYILHDEKDRIIPFSYSAEIAAKNDKVQLLMLHNTGHYKMLWHQEALLKIDEIISE